MERINIIKSIKEDILERGYSMALYNEKGLVRISPNSGIQPLLQAYETQQAKGLYAGDKIIGKASAILLVLMEVTYVFARVISEPGLEYLQRHNIDLEYEYSVPRVVNWDKTGLCPMEESVRDENDPQKAFILLKEKITLLSSQT